MASSLHSHEEAGGHKDGHTNVTMSEVTANARRATEKEHSMSLLQGIKLYPKAVAWSMLISTCIAMEGESRTHGAAADT